MGDEIHIGNEICKRLKEINRSKAWLAKEVHCDRSSFCKLLNRNYINTELLLQISLLLDKDFFTIYSAYIYHTKHPNDL
jgi:hypothetical protein